MDIFPFRVFCFFNFALDTKTERHQKMSNLCTFFAETKIFERPTFYGNQNMDKDLLDPKSSHMSPTNISSYSYAKCQFFSTFLLFLLLITATPTYEFRVKQQLSKSFFRHNFTSKFEPSLINCCQMPGFSIFTYIYQKTIFFSLYFIK